VQLGTRTIEHLVDAGCAPSLVRFQGDGKQVLVGSRADRSMTIFAAASGRTVVRLPLSVEPVNCCFNADGGQMFVTGPGMDAVAIVYPYQTEWARPFWPGGAGWHGGLRRAAIPVRANPNRETSGADIDTRKLVAALAWGRSRATF